MHFLLSLALLVSVYGCDSNVWTPVDEPDPAEAAIVALDNEDPDEAIDILEKALDRNPEDWVLVSLLASAKALKAGIDTTDIAINLANEGSKEQDNALTALFGLLPAPTESNVRLLLEAVSSINSIPLSARVPADAFKLSIYNTAFTALQAKILDNNGDGRFSVEELANLDEARATSIIESLANAEEAASGYQSGDATGTAAKRISEIRSQIDAQPGESQAERVRSFLGKRS